LYLKYYSKKLAICKNTTKDLNIGFYKILSVDRER